MAANGPDFEWFTDPADARAYLEELGRLWVVWLVALVGLLVFDGVLLLLTALGLVVAWLVLARPLQRRTTRLVGEEDDAADDGGQGATTRGRERDRILRELTLGKTPLPAALEKVGADPRWAYLRYVVVALTVLGFAYLVFGFLGSS